MLCVCIWDHFPMGGSSVHLKILPFSPNTHVNFVSSYSFHQCYNQSIQHVIQLNVISGGGRWVCVVGYSSRANSGLVTMKSKMA